jgi:hypothetical protein
VVVPVAAVVVDAVFAEDFAGVCVDHGDCGVVDEDGDLRTCVGGADAEVVDAAGAAEADLSEAVDVVVTDPVVRPAVLSSWGGFDGGGIGLGRGGDVERTVGPGLVVDAGEGVQLGLQLGESGGGGLRGEPALQGLVEAFDLALGLGMAGMAIFLGDAETGEQVLEAVAAAGEAGGVDRSVEFLTDVKPLWWS